MNENERKLLKEHPVGVSWEDPTVKRVVYSRFGRDWFRLTADTEPESSVNPGGHRRSERVYLLAKDGTRLESMDGSEPYETVMHMMMRLRRTAKYLEVHYAVLVVTDRDPDEPEMRKEVHIAEAHARCAPWKQCEDEIKWIQDIYETTL